MLRVRILPGLPTACYNESMSTDEFLDWIVYCCIELGWDLEAGTLLIEDLTWIDLFVDGATPAEAVAAQLNNLVGYADYDEE
jgi:hypothetical protein